MDRWRRSRIEDGRPRKSSLRLTNGAFQVAFPGLCSSNPQLYPEHSALQVSRTWSRKQSVYPAVSIRSRQPCLVWSQSHAKLSRGTSSTSPAFCKASGRSGVARRPSYPQSQNMRLEVSAFTNPMAPPQRSRALPSHVPRQPGYEPVPRPTEAAHGP